MHTEKRPVPFKGMRRLFFIDSMIEFQRIKMLR